MHKSRLGTLIIDCQIDPTRIDTAAAFWSQALGLPATQLSDAPEMPKYRGLKVAGDDPTVAVQAVAHESRVHLDIETDDLDAEVARLERLGARRIRFIERWWVMEAPTGQRFCVVRPQRADFETRANVWR